MNPEAKKRWFELVEEFMVKLGIKLENLYGMDATGCLPSNQGKEHVVGEQGVKNQHLQGGADCENVTALITICADGTVLHPSIIIKAKNFMSSWGNDNVSGASKVLTSFLGEILIHECRCRFMYSENGWTDGELAMSWMVKDFDAQTKEKANREFCVLLMDGHSSHYTLEILQYAKDNKIIILGYPPHCTHVIQGLNVICFAKMKSEFHRKIQDFQDLHFSNVTKHDFAGVFGQAFLHAFIPDSVKGAFTATGIYPFNPGIIPKKAMKLSLSTLIKGSFPLPQPSPVKAIILVMGSHPPTNFDLLPSHAIPGPSCTLPTSPITPSCTCPRSPVIDPSLETPSKRA